MIRRRAPPRTAFEVSLLEISAVIDLGHAQRDRRSQRLGGDPRAAVQDQRHRNAPADLVRAASRSRLALAARLDVDIADADGQQVDARGRDELGRRVRVGRKPAVRRSASSRRTGQLAQLALDGNARAMGQPRDRGDAPGQVIRIGASGSASITRLKPASIAARPNRRAGTR